MVAFNSYKRDASNKPEQFWDPYTPASILRGDLRPDEGFQLPPWAAVWRCSRNGLSPAAAGLLWASCAEPRPVTAGLCAGGSRSSRGSPWCSGGGSPVPSPWQNSSWGCTASEGRPRRCPPLPTDLRGQREGSKRRALTRQLKGTSWGLQETDF